MPEPPQRELFAADLASPDAMRSMRDADEDTGRASRHRCRGHPDRALRDQRRDAEALAMVSLIEQGWADQIDVARAFGRSDRSVRRYQRRFEDGGLAALGRPGGYPSGRPRTDRAQSRLTSRLPGEGKSLRQIADVVGVSEKAIRKQLCRLGWPAAKVVQSELPLPAGADPNLSGSAATGDEAVAAPAPGADPNLSGSAATGDEAGCAGTSAGASGE